MADEREGQSNLSKPAANEDRLQTGGREANVAQPERYPSVRQDDACDFAEFATGERRSFDPVRDAPSRPPQGAGDTSAPPAASEGRLGPGGDPSEGKR